MTDAGGDNKTMRSVNSIEIVVKMVTYQVEGRDTYQRMRCEKSGVSENEQQMKKTTQSVCLQESVSQLGK